MLLGAARDRSSTLDTCSTIVCGPCSHEWRRRTPPTVRRTFPSPSARWPWGPNIADAGLEEWAELVEGDAKETLPELEDGFDVVFLDAWKDDYELLFGLARTKLDPGGIVVADNVTTSSTVEAYAAARQADPTLVSVTVPIGHGLEVTTVLQP